MERTLKEREEKVFVDETKDVNEEELTITHWISTESVDRMGDIVRAKGMDNESYTKNPVVLYGHNYSGFPIGKSLWQKKSERNGLKGIIAKTQLAPTEEGRLVFELWKGGFLNAASIGFRPTETEPMMDDDEKWTGGFDIKKWELWEYSIVPVPANQDALRLAVEKGFNAPKILEPLREAVYEKRICDLEGCREKMESAVTSFASISEFQTLKTELEAIVAEMKAQNQTLLSEIEALKTPKVEKVAQLSGADLERAMRDALSGAFSRALGRV